MKVISASAPVGRAAKLLAAAAVGDMLPDRAPASYPENSRACTKPGRPQSMHMLQVPDRASGKFACTVPRFLLSRCTLTPALAPPQQLRAADQAFANCAAHRSPKHRSRFAAAVAGRCADASNPATGLDEDVVVGVDGCAVLQRDHLVVGVEAGVDLPLRRIELSEGGTGRAEPGEAEAVAGRAGVAGEVDDRVAGRFAGSEYEGVVAGIAGEQVVAALAVEHVVAGVANERVVVGVTGGIDVAAAVENLRLDVGTDREVDRSVHN